MLRDLLILYTLFFRMGAVTFGGGYAMLPILRREIIQNHQWMDEETIMDYYALSQGLPGIIAINVSVFIGYRRRGIPGGVAAALGMVSPCIIIISIIAFFLSSFQDNPYVQHALAGISVCVAALILDAVISMDEKRREGGLRHCGLPGDAVPERLYRPVPHPAGHCLRPAGHRRQKDYRQRPEGG